MGKKDSITQGEYLQLVGLDALARHHSKRLDDIRNAMHDLIGTTKDDDNADGWVSDLLYASDQTSVKMFLEGLRVQIEESADAAQS